VIGPTKQPLNCAFPVARGGIEPPTFRFSGGVLAYTKCISTGQSGLEAANWTDWST
jgi:hypothetical protein